MELYVRSILPQIMHLPTNDTSDSQNIAARVKERRRPVKKKQKQPRPAVTALDSPGSIIHNINNSSTLFHFMQFCLDNTLVRTNTSYDVRVVFNYFW